MSIMLKIKLAIMLLILCLAGNFAVGDSEWTGGDTSTNLVLNSGSENDFYGWYSSEGVSISNDGIDGSKCFYLERQSFAGNTGLRCHWVSVTGSGQMQVRYAYKAIPGATGDAKVQIRFFDYNDNYLGQDEFVLDADNTDWTYVSHMVKVKRGANKMDLHFVIDQPVEGAYCIDNAAAHRAPLDFNFSAPDHLYVIDYHSPDLSEVERVALITLQGILAQTKPEIYFLDYEDGRYALYLDDMKNRYDITTTRRNNFSFYINEYKDNVKGYILYDIDNSDSFSVAMSLAGVLKAIPLDVSLESDINRRWPELQKVMDCRGKTEQWLYDNYWDRFNHNAIIMHHTDMHEKPFLRDWGAAIKAMSWWNDDYSITEQVIDSLHDNSSVWGWGNPALDAGELNMVDFVSSKNVFQVPSNHMLNLPTFAGMASYEPEIELEQPISDKEFEKRSDVHHVAFMMSDMDNINVLFRPPSGWLDSEYFGQFPMGWGMPGAMAEIAPTVIDWWYRNVPETDSFSVQGGLGYMYPSKFSALDAYSTVLNGYMKNADIDTLVIPDNYSDGWDKPLTYSSYKQYANKFTRFDNLSGLFYVDVAGDYARYDGDMLWFDGKPMVTTRFTLWDSPQYDGLSRTGEQLANSINQLAADSTSEEGYSFVIVHAWSYGLEEVHNAIQDFDDNVRVVTPDEMIDQLYFNTKAAYWPLELDTENRFADNHSYEKFGSPEFTSEGEAKRGISAIRFDGDDDSIDFGNQAGSSEWLTAAFWMKSRRLQLQVPVDKLPNDNSGTGWNVKLRETGEIWFRVGSESNHQTIMAANGYSPGEWVHVACTLNENEGRLYINGELAAERTDIVHSPANTSVPIRIGKPAEAAVEEAFFGILDDVVIYGRPLSHEEIRSLMNDGPCSPYLKGDLNKDCRVDETDLFQFGKSWLEKGEGISADFDQNQSVDLRDFPYFSEGWQK
ncbi:LamG-like jellyroll fold domain-containing protein [Sedimentisphaera salicampi]|nr:LamG-like jellyroll fold domain-containing protein [Sedimentisphaera salicampi]